MSDLRKAAEQMLECLLYHYNAGNSNTITGVRLKLDEKAIREARTALAAPRPEPVAWAYCPECGSLDVRHEEGSHKQCATCFQEWFSDIDYSDVVQQNLNRLYTAPPAAAPDNAEALRRDAECYKRLKSRAEIYDGHVCFGDIRLPAPVPDRSPFDAIDEAVLAAAMQEDKT